MDPLIKKLPPEFVARLQKIIPASFFPSVLRTFIEKRPTTFRVNTIKSDRLSVLRLLKEQGIRLQDIPWYKDAFVLFKDGLRQLQDTSVYKEALIYVQGLSSMLPVLALAPQPGERIGDMCAAPGGKTCHIAGMAGSSSEIVAVEKIPVRFYKLCANVKLQAAETVRTVMMDSTFLWKKYPEYFDRILLDAPCSSEGQFLANEPRSFSYWKLRKVKEACFKQKRLLFSGIQSLRVGGMLVYSTCTFAPEENESVIDWAVRKFHDAIEVVPLGIPFPANVQPSLSSWEGRDFHPTVRKSVRVIPNQLMEGFFCAAIKKVSQTKLSEEK